METQETNNTCRSFCRTTGKAPRKKKKEAVVNKKVTLGENAVIKTENEAGAHVMTHNTNEEAINHTDPYYLGTRNRETLEPTEKKAVGVRMIGCRTITGQEPRQRTKNKRRT